MPNTAGAASIEAVPAYFNLHTQGHGGARSSIAQAKPEIRKFSGRWGSSTALTPATGLALRIAMDCVGAASVHIQNRSVLVMANSLRRFSIWLQKRKGRDFSRPFRLNLLNCSVRLLGAIPAIGWAALQLRTVVTIAFRLLGIVRLILNRSCRVGILPQSGLVRIV